MPIVCQEIGTPDLDALFGQIVLDVVRSQKPRNSEERGQRFVGILAERCFHRCDTLIDLLLGAVDRHVVHAQRMILGVGADGVAGIAELADTLGRFLGLVPDGEENRLDALRGEDFQNLIAVTRERAIVEGQHHFMIGERQCLGILHGPDTRVLPRIDDQSAGSSERIGMAGAVGAERRGRNEADGDCEGRPQSCPK